MAGMECVFSTAWLCIREMTAVDISAANHVLQYPKTSLSVLACVSKTASREGLEVWLIYGVSVCVCVCMCECVCARMCVRACMCVCV